MRKKLNRKVIHEMLFTAKEIYKNEPTGHDFGHIRRVLKYCKILHKNEGGDWNIIFASVLFHDVHRVLQSERGVFVISS